ncbi:hypothetical protein MMC29_004198 [Sticta canariensis]|nr:hypothetical protein [Sticta canariensis]
MLNSEYTIESLALEFTAAIATLDEEHGEIYVNEDGYCGGRIGQHNVVMAVQSKIGTNAASDLAARMYAAFTNIEYFLVVGIAGGVPYYGPPGAQSQIFLGDVVVSRPTGKYGGVIQYDFGAWIKSGRLSIGGHTDGPPRPLLSATNLLESRHSMNPGTKIPNILQEMRKKIHQFKQAEFEDPGPKEDRLFHDNYRHHPRFQDQDCEGNCDTKQSQGRQDRGSYSVRQTDTPYIHYGNIGSSDQLQLSAKRRKELQEKLSVICFEMEGAGVIQGHPALVIRGICDYSDSHKNEKWQKYAAATAAAYAKELLSVVPAQELTVEFPKTL